MSRSQPNTALYRDRAAERRDLHGDDDGADVTRFNGPAVGTSITAPLEPSHKGFKMLEKLGWKAGESLGKSPGMLEPVPMIGNVGRAGIGTEGMSCSAEL